MNLDTPGDTVIMGTKAGLRIPSTECWNGTTGGPMVLYHEVAGEQTQTEIPLLKANGLDGDVFYQKLRLFLNAVITGGSAPVPTSQILYNQAILDAVVKSAEAGHEVKVEIPEI